MTQTIALILSAPSHSHQGRNTKSGDTNQPNTAWVKAKSHSDRQGSLRHKVPVVAIVSWKGEDDSTMSILSILKLWLWNDHRN